MGSQFAGPFVFHTEEEPHDLGWEFHAPAINESPLSKEGGAFVLTQ